MEKTACGYVAKSPGPGVTGSCEKRTKLSSPRRRILMGREDTEKDNLPSRGTAGGISKVNKEVSDG